MYLIQRIFQVLTKHRALTILLCFVISTALVAAPVMSAADQAIGNAEDGIISADNLEESMTELIKPPGWDVLEGRINGVLSSRSYKGIDALYAQFFPLPDDPKLSGVDQSRQFNKYLKNFIEDYNAFYAQATGALELDAELISVTVDGAAYASGDAPVTIPAGQVFRFEVAMKNTGTEIWGDGERAASFLSRGPDYNETFGVFFISYGHGKQTAPGETNIYSTILRAPAEPGDYTMIWQLADWVTAYGYTYTTKPFYGDIVAVKVNAVPRTDAPPPEKPHIPGVLDINDFEYAGSFSLPKVPDVPQDEKAFFNSGITLRTVNGEKRMLLTTGTYQESVYEVAIPELGKFSGSDAGDVPVAPLRAVFGNLPLDPAASENGTMWYDQTAGLLYWTNLHSYYTSGAISFQTLRAARLDNGVLTEVKRWFQPHDMGGAPMKSFWGGVTRLPDSFAEKYTGGRKLALGFGGTYSIVSTAGWGPSFAAVSLDMQSDEMDLLPVMYYTQNGGGCVRDGNYIPLMYYNPLPTAPWLGHWTSGDSIKSGVFIDLPDKNGYVVFARQVIGRLGYDEGGNNWNAKNQNAWYFYDFDTLGQAALGEISKDGIEPSSIAIVKFPYDPTSDNQYVAGSCFDPDTRLLYLYTMFAYRTYSMYNDPVVHVYYVKEDASAPIMLEDVAVTANPTKIAYSQSDTLDLAGLVVTASYSDGSTKAVSGYSTSPAEGAVLNSVGAQTVTVSYTEDGVTKADSFTITVDPMRIELDSILIMIGPSKTAYTQGEPLNISGLVVTASYSDGSTKVVSGYTTSPVNGAVLNTVGAQTVTVSYTEGGVTKTTSFAVTIDTKLVVLNSITVTTSPSKTVYTQGEPLNLSGLVVTARYSDGSTKIVPGYSPADGAVLNTVGTLLVTVSYTEGGVTKSTSFTVTVNPKPTYTVSFNVDGKITSTTVNAGVKVIIPADPVKLGFTFDGWRTGSTAGILYDFNAPVMANLTLYAAWKENVAVGEIIITGVSVGNKQAEINFAIKSANGNGYTAYLSETGENGSFFRYSNLTWNAKGAQIKGLTNGKTYYAYIEYNDGQGSISRSKIVSFTPR